MNLDITEEILQQGAFGFLPPKSFETEDRDMGIYEDDEASHNSNDYNGFDRLETLESEKTMAMLLNNDFRIFEERYQYKEEIRKAVNDKEGLSRTPMYHSEGYEANVEQADNLEISRWQASFPFIQIVGEGFEEPTGLISQDRERNVSSSKSSEVEEVIAVNYTHGGKVVEQVQAEQKRQLIEQIWPCVVSSLDPIITQVVKEGEERNVPKDLTGFVAFCQNGMDVEEAHHDDFWD